MRHRVRRVCALALAATSLAATSALCDDLSMPLVVSGAKAPVTDWVVAFDLDFAEVGTVLGVPPKVDPAQVQVWETDAPGKTISQKRAQFVPVGEGDGGTASAGTLFWLMDGMTKPGAERHFFVRTKSGNDVATAPAGVSVRRSDGHLVVNSGRYEVMHDLKKGGTIVEIAFLDSGNRVPVRMKDSMRAKEWFETAQDDSPIVTVRKAGDSSPSLGAIIEVQTHFARIKANRSGWPRVTHRYTYPDRRRDGHLPRPCEPAHWPAVRLPSTDTGRGEVLSTFFADAWVEGLYRGGHAFLRPAAGGRAFWRAWCRDTETKGWVGVSPARTTGVERRVERQGDQAVRLRLTWPKVEAGPGSVRAEVTVVLDAESPLSKWKITIEPEGDRLSLWEVAFPIVGGIERDGSTGETDFLVFPYKGGARLPNPARAGLWELMYPGAAGWQFLAYWQGRDGLYVGAHDSTASVKTLKSLPTGDGSLELRMTHPVPNMGLPGTGFDMPFECMVGTFEGDWYDGTQVYREWLLKQEWVPRDPLHANADIPKWVTDSCVATRRSGLPERAIHTWTEEHASGFKEYHMGVAEEHEALGSPPTLMWWYHAWHPRKGVSRKFADSPDFHAPPGFTEGVRELKQRDIRVVSYSLSYWWDYSAPSWEKEHAERAVIIQEDGSQWLYHRRGVGIMCPAAKLYQQKMQRVMHQLLDQGPADGTYFDLGGTSGAAYCYSREHGHPVGSGSFPTAGKRALMCGMRAAARARNPEFAVIMEGNADCYLDAIDGDALFAGNVPVRHTLYSDYLRPAGAKRCLVERPPLEALNPAKHFAWGALLGRLYGRELLTRDKTAPEKVAYYKRLVRHKLVARPWLNYGRMPRPLKLTGVDPPDPAELVEGTMVPTGTWRAPDGSVAFVFANARQSAGVSFRYTIDPHVYGIPTDGSAALYRLTPEGEAPKPRFEKQIAITGPVPRGGTLSAGSVLVLVARAQ